MRLFSSIAIAAVTLAFAAQAEPAMDGKGPPATRQEAIARAQEHLDKLKKMSDADWKQMHEKRQQRREAWKNMTPEQREQAKETFKALRGEKPAQPPAPAPAR